MRPATAARSRPATTISSAADWWPPCRSLFRQHHPDHRQPVCEIARSHAADIELALDAAHAAKDAWGKTSPARARRHPHQDRRPHGGQISSCSRRARPGTTASRSARPAPPTFRSPSTTSAISPACIRAQEGSLRETRPRHRRLSLPRAARRRRPDHPVELPDPDGGWKLAPALAAGNCVVLKPAEQTPVSIMVLMELIGDLLPPACSTSSTASASRPASRSRQHKRIAKIAFTGETTTGRLIMQYAVREPDPGDAGAGRQVAEHLLRRRDGRGRRLLRQGARRLRHVRASTRARSAPARRARWSRKSSTTLHGARHRAGRTRSSRATRSTPTP